jgi:hypothetical protein
MANAAILARSKRPLNTLFSLRSDDVLERIQTAKENIAEGNVQVSGITQMGRFCYRDCDELVGPAGLHFLHGPAKANLDGVILQINIFDMECRKSMRVFNLPIQHFWLNCQRAFVCRKTSE